MTIRFLLVTAIVMMVESVVSAALPAPAPPVRETKPGPVYPARALKPERPIIDSDVQQVVYLAEGGPLFLRLHIRVDGKSYNALWRNYIARLFRSVDRDGNRLISRDEAQQGLPSYQQLTQTGLLRRQPRQPRPQLPENMFASATMTRQELADYYRRIGLMAFQLQVGSRYTSQRTYGRAAYGAQRTTSALLLARLDSDGNERLSAPELRSALFRLRKLDLDDDGTISQTELQLIGSSYAATSGRITSRTRRPVVSGDPFVALSPGQVTDTDVRRVLSRYDKPDQSSGTNRPKGSSSGDDMLNRSEIGLPQAVFRKYDRDHNGRLDFEELRGLLNNPPSAIDVVTRLGHRDKSQPGVAVRNLIPAAGITVRTGTGGLVFLNVNRTQIRLVADTTADSSARTRALYSSQFKFADRDKNGYLTLSEVARNYYFRTRFKLMDRDDDGKVFKEEMLAYLASQAALASSRVFASVSDQGRDLFKMLDGNRDGRLGQKEFATAARRLIEWDKNGDRLLALNEVPRNLVLTISRGRPRVYGGGRVLVGDLAARTRSPVRRMSSSGPLWFRKMDVNSDGDVARREFLGTATQFAKLDADQDGVIDSKEAAVLSPHR